MKVKSTTTVLNDPKIETVLEKLHGNADGQLSSLIWHYLPKLPRLLMGKGIKWDMRHTNFYNDKYIPIEREQGYFLDLLARSINSL